MSMIITLDYHSASDYYDSWYKMKSIMEPKLRINGNDPDIEQIINTDQFKTFIRDKYKVKIYSVYDGDNDMINISCDKVASNGTIITDEIRQLFKDYAMLLNGWEQGVRSFPGSMSPIFDFCDKCGNHIANRFCSDCQLQCIKFLVEFRKENNLY